MEMAMVMMIMTMAMTIIIIIIIIIIINDDDGDDDDYDSSGVASNSWHCLENAYRNYAELCPSIYVSNYSAYSETLACYFATLKFESK